MKKIIAATTLLFITIFVVLPFTSSAQSDQNIKGLKKGWNILANDDRFLSASTYSYAYAPFINKYFLVKPEQPGVNDEVVAEYGKLGKSYDEAKKYLESSSYWFYFDSDKDISFSGLHDPKLSDIILAPGWNFKYFTPSMEGKSFESILGNCTLNKAYMFSPDIGWINILDKSNPVRGELDKINSLVGFGFLVNVDRECAFGDKAPAIPPPPQLPSLPN